MPDNECRNIYFEAKNHLNSWININDLRDNKSPVKLAPLQCQGQCSLLDLDRTIEPGMPDEIMNSHSELHQSNAVPTSVNNYLN